MEQRESKMSGRTKRPYDPSKNGDDEEQERPARAVPIPDHFRQLVPSNQKAPTAAAPTSQDYASKAEQLRLEMEALEAERQKRMAALLEKKRKQPSRKE